MRGKWTVPISLYILVFAMAALFLPLASAQSGSTVPGGGAVLAPTMLEENTCYTCHNDAAKVEDTSAAENWVGSVHYDNNIGCERCHSASVPAGRLAVFDAFGGSYRDDHADMILEADIDYKSPESFENSDVAGEYSSVVRTGLVRQQSVAMCARCHGLTPLTPDSPKNVFPNYLASVHGQSVVVKGLGDPQRVGQTEVSFTEVTGALDSAVCTDCHDAHATTSKTDSNSPTYKDNVPTLCGSEKCHASDEVAEKYGIVNAFETYEKHHHGKALKLGNQKSANCVDCHGTEGHLILSADNPSSDTHPNNLAKTCAKEDCHGVQFNIGSGSLHGKDADTLIGNLIDLFYWILIPAVVGFFALYIVLDFTLLAGKKGGK